MGHNVLITTEGLNFAASASPDGLLVAIKYFLPSYDYRIDSQVHNEVDTTTMAVSASMSQSDTVPYGELIWNIDENTKSYSLSNSDSWYRLVGSETVTSAGTDWIVEGAVQSQFQPVNLYEGIPLSRHISGSDIDLGASDGAVTIYDAALVIENNDVPTETKDGFDRYYPVTHYYPVTDGSRLRGSFKCRLTKNIGTVKFNKIGLYAVRVNSSGEVVDGSATLFAECGLTDPVIKTDYGTEGFDDIVIDVQVQIDSFTSAWGDVFFSTSGDYWARTPGGVYYPEKVGIGSFEDSLQEPQAKLHVKYNGIDYEQLRLGYNDVAYSDIGTNEFGNLEIYVSSGAAMVPETSSGITLGTATKPFGTLYVSGTGDTVSVNIEDGSIRLGGSTNAIFVDMPITITDTGTTSGAFVGGDLYRLDEDVLVYSKSSYGSSDIRDVWIFGGIVDDSPSYSTAQTSTGQIGATHKNILYNIDNNVRVDSYLDRRSNINILPGSEKVYIRGSIIPFLNTTSGYYSIGNSNRGFKIYTDSIRAVASNNISIAGNLVGSTSYNVGSSDLYWNKGYFTNLYAGSDIYLNNKAIGSWTTIGNGSFTVGNSTPVLDNSSLWSLTYHIPSFGDINIYNLRYTVIGHVLIIKFFLKTIIRSVAGVNISNSKTANIFKITLLESIFSSIKTYSSPINSNISTSTDSSITADAGNLLYTSPCIFNFDTVTGNCSYSWGGWTTTVKYTGILNKTLNHDVTLIYELA